ncbi:unnamed protein product [Blepharisma stoltei]|uniref:Protein kinase domain-containing protein n=1 Tax=Blepharisma stoltei TaxID=1481888 RepID=A0AAU9IY07_9CILI|nr:unnamed protein product [Blepharisma stoltei]
MHQSSNYSTLLHLLLMLIHKIIKISNQVKRLLIIIMEVTTEQRNFNMEELKIDQWHKYQIVDQIAVGTFGVVYKAINRENSELVAIKKIRQDPRYQNRELEIMRLLTHDNIITLRNAFLSKEGTDREYLNVVMDYFPETILKPIQNSLKKGRKIPELVSKLYMYQLLRALGHMHSLGICHRDVKPLNILLDSKTHIVSLCDLGSSKRLIRGEANIAYICSRYYRAPELIFGSTRYSESIDIWSAGCIAAELLIGKMLFVGSTRITQLIEIIKIMGTPSREEIYEMNPKYREYKFPFVKVVPLFRILDGASKNAIDFVSSLLQYSPSARPKALEALLHPWFDELRNQNCRLPSGNPLPDIFNWTNEERNSVSPDVIERLTPSWYRIDPSN